MSSASDPAIELEILRKYAGGIGLRDISNILSVQHDRVVAVVEALGFSRNRAAERIRTLEPAQRPAPGGPAGPEIVAAVLRIPLDDLVHGPNARGDLGDVTELANQLRSPGQQQPILVEPRVDGRWSVFDGNRRLKAARQAGLTHLLAIPRKTALSNAQRMLLQLGMHGTMRPFDPMAEATAVEWLMFADDGPHMSREDIARALSRSPTWVKGRVDLLQLAPDEQDAVRNGTMPVAVAHSAIAVRRGGRPATTLKAPHCDLCRRCDCVCHKRNQVV